MDKSKPALTQEWALESIKDCMERTGASQEEATRLFSLEMFGKPDALAEISKLPRKTT